MCLGTATARADDSPETDCDVIAVRLHAIGVFEPVLSPTASVFCLLITLYVRVSWLKNDRAAARIVRTVLWLSRRRDEAVRILRYVLVSVQMLLQLRRGFARKPRVLVPWKRPVVQCTCCMVH
jgi:hypothetical protein